MKNDPGTANFAEEEGVKAEGVSLSSESVEVIRGLLDQADHYLRSVRHLIFEQVYQGKAQALGQDLGEQGSDGQRILEGVFDGEQMVGSDRRHYPVPPNYASKSKLVAGDILKLTIAHDGTFIYKQIGPIERQKLLAVLEESNGRYLAAVDGKRYQLLTASVTYYHARPGDQLTIVVPRDTESEWAAVENLLSQGGDVTMNTT
ncbi:MAG: hypothetical protein AAB647_01065 [Patescibacteria group bacterium]